MSFQKGLEVRAAVAVAVAVAFAAVAVAFAAVAAAAAAAAAAATATATAATATATATLTAVAVAAAPPLLLLLLGRRGDVRNALARAYSAGLFRLRVAFCRGRNGLRTRKPIFWKIYFPAWKIYFPGKFSRRAGRERTWWVRTA